jgi:outer membrane protein OmpA-like peptidoglycan-associated protein
VRGTAAAIAVLLFGSAPLRAQSSTTPALGSHRSGQLSEQLGRGRVVLREIRFGPGSDRIAASSVTVLRELARALTANPGVFLIEGHTDPSGGAEAGQLLSERRAVAVKAWLVSEGVAAGRLLAVGYGSSRPLGTNRKHNARIEVTRVQ